MDYFFSFKGKEAMLVSGFLGIFIYYIFMSGEEYQNKFYFILLGYGIWFIIKNIYWSLRISKIVQISNEDYSMGCEEIDKIRKHDEVRADKIYNIISRGRS